MSLVPGATELVVALGASDRLVGISHECDYPESVQTLPRISWTAIQPDADSAAIDAQVRALKAAGKPAIAVDAPLLESLQPTLILTARADARRRRAGGAGQARSVAAWARAPR